MSQAAAAPPTIASPKRRRFAYIQQSELPLYSLIFLLPPLIIFELLARFQTSNLIAFHLLQRFFASLGASGRFIPALALVGILLTWHVSRKDPWKIEIGTIWLMAVESVALSLPLLILGIAFAHWNIHAALQNWRGDAILSLGAGIYEELVFRLILMTLLMVLFADVLRMRQMWASLLMVWISAILFALYHYLGTESFQWQSFAFRTLAGVYFAVLFLTRGFGITSGCHISYGILRIVLQMGALG
jgi:membrane protease YdiL (CAAX protease family)